MKNQQDDDELAAEVNKGVNAFLELAARVRLSSTTDHHSLMTDFGLSDECTAGPAVQLPCIHVKSKDPELPYLHHPPGIGRQVGCLLRTLQVII